MRHLTLIPTLAICTSVVAYAQGQTQSFSGQVLDEAGKPLGYATVAMLRADSTLISGATTDADGHFALSSEEAVSLLRISSVGYEQAYLDAHAFASPIRLRPTAVQIEGVEVRAQRPQVKLMGGALVLGVQGTTLVHQPNMLGLLGQVPGLLVSQSGKVELVSKGTLLVLLNGREVHAMDEVLSLDVKQVKSVRLETNPSARYRGTVSAVLHVQTIKQNEGLHLRLTQWSRLNHYFSHNGEVQVGYTTPRANYSARLGYGDYRNLSDQELTSERLASTPLEELRTDLTTGNGNKRGWLQTSADFPLSPKLSLGAKYNASLSKHTGDITDHSKAYTVGVLVDEIISRGAPKNKAQYHHLNAFASWQTSDKLNLTLNADLFAKQSDRLIRTQEETPSTGMVRQIHMETESKSTLWQLNPVLTYSLSGGQAIELGGEVQNIRSDSHQDYSGTRTGEREHAEQMYAGFGSYRFTIGSWSARLGLRYEYAQNRLDNLLSHQREVERTYSNLFYNAQISGQIGKTAHSLSLRSSIQRPSVESLSGNYYESSKYLIQESNPKLTNQTNYILGYNLSYGFLYLGVDYTYTKDLIQQYFYPDPAQANGYIITMANYDKAHLLQVVANANKTWGWYNLNATLGGRYSKVSDRHLGMATPNRPWWFVKLTQGFSLPKGYHLNLDYMYMHKTIETIYNLESKHSLDFFASKSFFKDRLQVTLQLTDILRSGRTRGYSETGGIRLGISDYSDAQSVSLKLVYRLNKEKGYRGKDAAREGINRL